jgi:glycosyltransferase involved in cell wall biosynthesis
MGAAAEEVSDVHARAASAPPRLVVVVPFQNEQAWLPRLLASIDQQTRRPDKLILVDDGSTDASLTIAQRFAAERPWVDVQHLPPRPQSADRLAQAHELKAFQFAVEQLDGPWDVVGKLDADLELNPRHFGHLLEALQTDPLLGIAGAHLSDLGKRGKLTRQPSPSWHVHGATKMYRRACYEAIQPIPHHLGWDMIDGAKARMLGWRTLSVSLPGGDTLHLRPTGSYNGLLRGFMRWGECAWRYGAHPLWILLGVVKRLSWRPYVLGGIFYGVGYALAAARRLPRADGEVVSFVRTEEAAEVRNRLRRPGGRSTRAAEHG